jgi:hydroxymethylbilane synthase
MSPSHDSSSLATGLVAACSALAACLVVYRAWNGGQAAPRTKARQVKLGTRGSALAMVQTRWVAERLAARYPDVDFVVTQGISAHGDQVLNVALKDIVVKTPGLFTKELEDGLVSRQYDVVVHSLKDVPTTLPEGLAIAAVTEREDPRDALVVNAKHRNKGGLKGLPKGAVVGTSSVRREALLRRDYPHLDIKLIRGNVNTRLRKLDDGEFDAILLAIAGLNRLGARFAQRAEQLLDPVDFPYGVSQGALGLECRAQDEDVAGMLRGIGHEDTTHRCLAERALLRHLQGGCQVPLGVCSLVSPAHSAAPLQKWLEISCSVLSADGRVTVSSHAQGPADTCEALGTRLAGTVLDAGARHLVEGWSAAKGAALPRPLTYGSAE